MNPISRFSVPLATGVNKIFIYLFILISSSRLSGIEHGQNLVLFPLIFAAQNVFNLGLTNSYLKLLSKGETKHVHLSMLIMMFLGFICVCLLALAWFNLLKIKLSIILILLIITSSFISSLTNHFSQFFLFETNKLPYLLIQAVWKVSLLATFLFSDMTLLSIYILMAVLLTVNALVMLYIMRKNFEGLYDMRLPGIIEKSGIKKSVFLFINGIMSLVVLFYNRLYVVGNAREVSDFNTLLLLPGVFLFFYAIFYKLYVPRLYMWIKTNDFDEWNLPITGTNFLVIFSFLGYALLLVYLRAYKLSIESYESYALMFLLLYIVYYFYALFNDLLIYKDGGRYLLLTNLCYFILTIVFRQVGFESFGGSYLVLHFIFINMFGVIMISLKARYFLHRALVIEAVKSMLQIAFILTVMYFRLMLGFPLVIMILVYNLKPARIFLKELFS